MKSLIACQNEASRGLSSASRLTALSSSSSAARRAARFVPTGVRKSRILSSAVGSLFASNSDDRAREPQGFHACIEASTHDHAQRAYSVWGCIIRSWYRPRDGSVVSSVHCMNDPQPEGHMASYIRRRKFLATLLGGAAVAWPFAAHAQQPPKIPRIGFLGATTAAGVESRLKRFRAGLRDLGYIEGENLLIDFRWAEGNYARLAEFAAELVGLKVDVLVTYGTPGTLAAQQATTTMPIVMTVSGDAVATGIVASLARPGGNVTGSSFFSPELIAKRLELLKDAVPSARSVAFLFNPNNPVEASGAQLTELAAKSLGLDLQPFEVRNLSDFERMGSTLVKTRIDAVAVTDDSILLGNSRRIAEMATSNRLPSIGSVDLAQAGGLIGYGPNLLELWYRAATFVDRILKGAKPADLPIEQPTKFELVINLKTARTLGLTV